VIFLKEIGNFLWGVDEFELFLLQNEAFTGYWDKIL
jgi:hypothetical protein